MDAANGIFDPTAIGGDRGEHERFLSFEYSLPGLG